MTILTDDDVRSLLDIQLAVKSVAAVLKSAAERRSFGPLRGVVAAPRGWFAAMPAYVEIGAERALGAKLVTFFPENASRGEPTHRATILLFDPDSGVPLASLGGEYLTEVRTAAASIVATRALGRPGPERHAILGSGAQARAHLHAYHAFGMLASLHVWSRGIERAERFALQARTLGVQTFVHAGAGDAVRRASVVTTVTGASEPLFADDAIAPGTHINAVGACVPQRRELPAALVRRAQLFADSREGALREAGDLILASHDARGAGEISVGELGDVLAGKLGGRSREDRVTVFESLGIGIEDVAVAAAVFERHKARAAGAAKARA